MIIPLRTIIFQAFFLVIFTAIESSILYTRLKIGRKTSVEYAACMNFVSAIFGWVTLFISLPLLPQELRAQIISYILFNRFFYPTDYQPILWLIVILSVGFFVSLFVKIKSIELLRLLLKPEIVQNTLQAVGQPLNILAEPILSMTGIKIKNLQDNSQFQNILLSRRQGVAILWGHATSSTLILIIFFLKSILS